MACIYYWNWKKLKQLSLPPRISAFDGTECLLGIGPGAARQGAMGKGQIIWAQESCVLLCGSTKDGLWYLVHPSKLFVLCHFCLVSKQFWGKDFFFLNIFMTHGREKKIPKHLLGKPTAVMQIIDNHMQLINFLFCVVFHTEQWGKREVFKNRKMWLRKHRCWQEDSVDSGNNVALLFIML